MAVAQRQIIQAAVRYLRGGNGAVGRGRIHGVAVDDGYIHDAVLLFRGKAVQKRGAVPGGEARAPDTDAQLRQEDAFHAAAGEDMHIFRDVGLGVGRKEIIKIVIARGDKYRGFYAAQRAEKRLNAVAVGLVIVEHVPGQQHDIGASVPGQPGDGVRYEPQLLPALGRLFLRKPLKGRIQMQVGGVEYGNGVFHHSNLTALAPAQRPVSASMVKMQPSILHGPPALA